VAILADYPEVTQRRLEGLLDLETLTDAEKGFLEAVSGVNGTSVTLSGAVQLDVSTAFQNWYEDTTEDMILDPLTGLRDSIQDLRDVMQEQVSLTQQQLDAIELEAAYDALAELNAQQQELAQIGRDLVEQQGAAEAEYGVTVWDDKNNKEAHIGYSASDNQLNYAHQNASIMYTVGDEAAAEAFREDYFAPGGLHDTLVFWHSASRAWADEIANYQSLIMDLGGVVPAYADGTSYHLGGLALVGEEGPELVELPTGAKVHTATETSAMLPSYAGGTYGASGFGMVAECIDELKDEVVRLRAENTQLLLQMERHTERSARVLKKADRIGLPVRNPDDGTALDTV